MDPITLIVTALAAGAAAAGDTGASRALADAYAALVAAITDAYPQVNAAVLEAEPGSKGLQAYVQKQLAQTGAGQDVALLEQAQALLKLVEAQAPAAAQVVGVNLAGVIAGGDVIIRDVTINIQAAAPVPAAPPPPPFQSPAPGPEHVARADVMEKVLPHLLDAGGQLLPNTVGLHGFGGSGKTIMARLVCADPALRAACTGGILWVELGKTPPEPRATMADLVTALTGQCNGCATLDGARGQLRAALAGRQVLLALDDVWNAAHVKDLLEASEGSARLITTRNPRLLPAGARPVKLGPMEPANARTLLGAGLPAGNNARLDSLADRLGYWPVLLSLANGTLRYRIDQQNTPPAQSLDEAESDLKRRGVVAFDPDEAGGPRALAVAATVEASLELLKPDQRRRYSELAIFPPDASIPLLRAAQLWQLTAGLDFDSAREFVTRSLEPLSLLEYDGGSFTLRLHDVLRSYLYEALPDRADLHGRLAARWTDHPPAADSYAWRWLAWHRAWAARTSPQPARHSLSESLAALVDDPTWQAAHEASVKDLPALEDALETALDAAVADDDPLGIALIVRAADALVQFRREHQRAEPLMQLARDGDLAAVRRRTELFDIDEHWRQALLLAAAWLAPQSAVEDARKLCDDVLASIGADAGLYYLAQWARAGLWPTVAAPGFPPMVPPHEADAALIEQLVKRVGGLPYDRGLIISRGLDPDVQDPDRPPPFPRIQAVPGTALEQGLLQGAGSGDAGETRSTTRYLAELDGPYLVMYAAQHPVEGMAALEQYVSIYGNYNYPEYRYSTLWLLLGYVAQYPRQDGGHWVQEAVGKILSAALGGPSVEFEEGLAIAVTGLRAHGGDDDARDKLVDQAQWLVEDSMQLRPRHRQTHTDLSDFGSQSSRAATGLDPDRGKGESDIRGWSRRRMLAAAQAIGWLLGDQALADQVLQNASALEDSGFAGFQAPACLALAEAIHVCQPANQTAIDEALDWAQQAAHNVQDPSFCARMTARVNAMRQYWWPQFPLRERFLRLSDAAWLPEYAGLHRVGHLYEGRRDDALTLPDWAKDANTFDALARLYQRPVDDLRRLNGGDHPLNNGDEVAVPDPGFLPHLAARLAAEVLVVADAGVETLEPLPWLRALVPYAVRSPTALDAVLTRLVLAQGRWDLPPGHQLADALDAVLARRKPADSSEPASELIAGANHSRLPT